VIEWSFAQFPKADAVGRMLAADKGENYGPLPGEGGDTFPTDNRNSTSQLGL
jgi:hypothetical protein